MKPSWRQNLHKIPVSKVENFNVSIPVPSLFCMTVLWGYDMYQRRCSIHFNGINLLFYSQNRGRENCWCWDEGIMLVQTLSLSEQIVTKPGCGGGTGEYYVVKVKPLVSTNQLLCSAVQSHCWQRLLNQVKYSWYVKVTRPSVKLFNLTWHGSLLALRLDNAWSVWPQQLVLSATEGDNLKLKLLQLSEKWTGWRLGDQPENFIHFFIKMKNFNLTQLIRPLVSGEIWWHSWDKSSCWSLSVKNILLW